MFIPPSLSPFPPLFRLCYLYPYFLFFVLSTNLAMLLFLFLYRGLAESNLKNLIIVLAKTYEM